MKRWRNAPLGARPHQQACAPDRRAWATGVPRWWCCRLGQPTSRQWKSPTDGSPRPAGPLLRPDHPHPARVVSNIIKHSGATTHATISCAVREGAFHPDGRLDNGHASRPNWTAKADRGLPGMASMKSIAPSKSAGQCLVNPAGTWRPRSVIRLPPSPVDLKGPPMNHIHLLEDIPDPGLAQGTGEAGVPTPM